MNSKLYLFLPSRSSDLNALNSVKLSWVFENTNNEFQLAQGLLSDVASVAGHHHITAVLPGEDVLFLTAQVPGKNVQRVRQAIPYVEEDSVIEDVDELYFAVNKSKKSDSDSQYDVSVVNKQYFESVVKQLEMAGIYADAMIADYWLLPDNNTLFINGKRVSFNGADLKFSAVPGSTIHLTDYGIPGKQSEQTIYLINCEHGTDADFYSEQLIVNHNIKKVPCNTHYLLCLIKSSVLNEGVNLLQGKYKKKKNWSQAGKRWLPAAALFFLWLSVQGGLFIVDYVSLNNQNTKLNAEIVEIYKTAFPGSRRIIDAKAQMKQKLKDLKMRKGQSGRSFSEMLSVSGSVLAKTSGLKIKTLRYYDGRINLELQVKSLQALDKLKNELSNVNKYNVEIQNASSGKENVTARLQITGAES